MARQQRPQAPQDASSADGVEASAEEARQGMRAHDDQGNVRPADGRWPLHHPKDESKHVRSDRGRAPGKESAR